MKLSPLTPKILAYKEISGYNMDDTIDWAIDMIQSGYETPSLLILAGISKPTTYAEAESYLTGSLKELHIKIPERKKVIVDYCKFFIEKIAEGKDVKENLHKVYLVSTELSDEKAFIKDFYFLQYAWEDLDDDPGYQSYWPEANKENIREIVIATAQEWLADNSPALECAGA